MALFCVSLISWFLSMLLRYFLNDFDMVPVSLIINGITLFVHAKCMVLLLQDPNILESSQFLL